MVWISGDDGLGRFGLMTRVVTSTLLTPHLNALRSMVRRTPHALRAAPRGMPAIHVSIMPAVIELISSPPKASTIWHRHALSYPTMVHSLKFAHDGSHTSSWKTDNSIF